MPPLVPGTTTRLLTRTHKMPCRSWSLPSLRSCPGAVLGDGTVCDDCYATKRTYTFPSVVAAQEARYQWTRECLKTPEGREYWQDVMHLAIYRACTTQRHTTGRAYFRVHDSGDLFSPLYTLMWRQVCADLPWVTFWFPTRNHHQGVNLILRAAAVQLATLPNVTVRPSALLVNAQPPTIEGLHAGTGVSDDDHGYTCPSHTTDDACADCRACWDDKTTTVVYRRH